MTIRIRNALFDFDGTLVDSSEAICIAFNRALEAHGFSPIPDTAVRRMIGRPLVNMFQSTVETESVDELVQVYRAEFSKEVDSRTNLLPGVKEMIPEIARGRTMGIVTSRSGAGTRRLLHRFGLDGYFEVVVGVEDVELYKPNPEPLLSALEKLGVTTDSSAYIGDTPMDIEAALRARIFPVGIATGFYSKDELSSAGAEAVLDHFVQIDSVL